VLLDVIFTLLEKEPSVVNTKQLIVITDFK